jgi:hypothetical protein
MPRRAGSACATGSWKRDRPNACFRRNSETANEPRSCGEHTSEMASDVLWRLGPDSEKHNTGRRGQPASKHEFAEVTVKGDDDTLLGCAESKYLLIRCARADKANRHDVVPVRLQATDCLKRDVLVSEKRRPTQGRAQTVSSLRTWAA